VIRIDPSTGATWIRIDDGGTVGTCAAEILRREVIGGRRT